MTKPKPLILIRNEKIRDTERRGSSSRAWLESGSSFRKPVSDIKLLEWKPGSYRSWKIHLRFRKRCGFSYKALWFLHLGIIIYIVLWKQDVSSINQISNKHFLGVMRIMAHKTKWGRLFFIMKYSWELDSRLGFHPDIAGPKEFCLSVTESGKGFCLMKIHWKLHSCCWEGNSI